MAINGSGSGGIFDLEDDYEAVPFATLERSQRNVTLEREFYPIYTHWITVLYTFLIMVFFVTLFISFDETGPGYNLIIIIYIFIWIVLSVVNRFIHVIHMKAKRHGYFKFYSSTNFITQVPFIVWSAVAKGMAVIGLIFVFVPAGTTLWGLKPASYLQICVGLQVIIISIASTWYFVICFMHNKKKSLPDASEYLQSFEGNKSLGVKQAEVIRYLEEKNVLLGKEIVSLNKQLEEQKEQAESFAKSDYVHEISKKDNEILRLEGMCANLKSQLEQFEQQKLDKIEDKYAENHRELSVIRAKLAESQQENNKLKLMYEVEKDSLEEALGEIELLRQTIANNGSLPEEKTIYD